MTTFDNLFAKVVAGGALDEDEAVAAIDALISGDVPPTRIAGFLIALKVRGETQNEIIGGIRALRARCLMVDAPAGAIDVCGTGGDGQGTLNISTSVAIVVAACGVPVAKHGNRAVSSQSGSADVLAALGINLDLSMAQTERCMREIGIAFLSAPRHHPAMAHVAPVRRELGVRTLFNLLGPPSNPADVRYQLMGVYDRKWLVPMATALGRLGATSVWVVHGAGGLDELALDGLTEVAEWTSTGLREFTLDPRGYGLEPAPISALAGGTVAHNAAALLQLLEGAPGPYQDMVCWNTSAALVVAGHAADLADGLVQARHAITSGAALKLLERWRRFDHS